MLKYTMFYSHFRYLTGCGILAAKTTMDQAEKLIITVTTTANVPLEKAWKIWTTPEDICRWNTAAPEWHTPSATNDLRPGGSFSFRMEARDGSFGFDFGGIYDEVITGKKISYSLGDGRKVTVLFEETGNATQITESFEAESENSAELQQQGWQAILDNFARYAEGRSS